MGKVNKDGLVSASVLPIILLVVLLCGSLFEQTNYRLDGPILPVHKNAMMFSVFNDNDTIFTPLSEGDSVRFIGYEDSSYRAECLVETKEGIRGWIPMWMLDIDMICKDKKYAGDTMKVNYPKKYNRTRYGLTVDNDYDVTAVLADGQPVERIVRLDLYPAIKDFSKFELRRDHSFTKIMSMKKFKKLADEISFGESEGKLGPMENIARRDNGEIEVRYHTYVFNPDNGKFYNPVVTFGADSIAVATGTREATDRSDWLLKYTPLAAAIYNFGPTTFFARTDIYNSLNNTGRLMSGGQKVWYWTKWVVVVICALIWLFASCALPVSIMFALLMIPKIFFHFSDSVMRLLMGIVAVISAYYWLVVLLGWGSYWWLVPIVIYAAYFFWESFTVPLEDFIPHERCQKCRSMGTMKYDEKEFLNSEYVTENTTKSHKIGSNTRKWQTWTQVTQGSSTWKEDVKDHWEKDTTWRDDHYKENVRYDNYMIHYQCSVCGYRERKRDSIRAVLDSEYKGSSTYTTHQSSD